jgi:hypothetical protein
MRFRLLAIIALLMIVLIWGGCSLDSNEAVIQGTWIFDHNPGRLATDHQPANDFQYWTFDNGHYRYYSCCLHKHEEQGRYQIVKSEGDVLVLELFEGATTRFGGREIRIDINRDKDVLKIFNKEPFVRGLP